MGTLPREQPEKKQQGSAINSSTAELSVSYRSFFVRLEDFVGEPTQDLALVQVELSLTLVCNPDLPCCVASIVYAKQDEVQCCILVGLACPFSVPCHMPSQTWPAITSC